MVNESREKGSSEKNIFTRRRKCKERRRREETKMSIIRDFLCPKCGKLLGKYDSDIGAAKGSRGYLFFWCRRCHEERYLDIGMLHKFRVS